MKHILQLGRPATSYLRCIEQTKQCHSPILRCAPGARTFHTSPQRREEQGKESRSFRGQLYESTADRLKREREEQTQYIKASGQRRREPRTLALSLGKYFQREEMIPADRHSHSVCGRCCILARHQGRESTRRHVHHSFVSSASSSA